MNNSDIDKLIVEILSNPELKKVIDAFNNGKTGLIGLLTGIVMKESENKADPKYVVERLNFYLQNKFK